MSSTLYRVSHRQLSDQASHASVRNCGKVQKKLRERTIREPCMVVSIKLHRALRQQRQPHTLCAQWHERCVLLHNQRTLYGAVRINARRCHDCALTASHAQPRHGSRLFIPEPPRHSGTSGVCLCAAFRALATPHLQALRGRAGAGGGRGAVLWYGGASASQMMHRSRFFKWR